MMMEQEEESDRIPITFTNLPEEIAVKILYILPIEDKKSSRLVWRDWCRILDEIVVFRVRIKNSSNLKDLFETRHTLEKVSVFEEESVIANQLTGSEMEIELDDKFIKIRNLVLNGKCSREVALTLLDYGCTVLESLKICSKDMTQCSSDRIGESLRNNKWDHLMKLELLASIYSPNELTGNSLRISTNVLTCIQSSTLQEFKFDFTDYPKPELDSVVQQLFEAMYNFLTNHAGTLKDFKIHCYAQKGLQLPESPASFMNCVFKLRTADIGVAGIRNPANLLLPLLLGGKIETMDFTDALDYNPNLHDVIKQALENNKQTLERLSLKSQITATSGPVVDWLKLDETIVFSKMNFLRLNQYGNYQVLPPSYEQLIRKSSATLEHLIIPSYDEAPATFRIPDWSWLNSCKALKKLKIHCYGAHNLASNRFADTFVNLRELDVMDLKGGNHTDPEGNKEIRDNLLWMAWRMPNLESLRCHHTSISIPILTILLNQTKLTKIHFWLLGSRTSIVDYCESLGGISLGFTRTPYDFLRYHEDVIIEVDRKVFIPPAP